MRKRSKRYSNIIEKIDREKSYTFEEALKIVKDNATAKYNETVNISVRLSVNPKKAEEQVRGTVILPKGTGKEVKVLVFAKGEKIKEAEASGADYIGDEETAEKIRKENWIDYDAVISTPDCMKIVGSLGKILGPRALMPNPKAGTVTFDVKGAIQRLKAGQIEYRTDKNGIVRSILGKAKFELSDLIENCKTFLIALIKSKPASIGGRHQYMRSVFISSSAGPGIKLDVNYIWNELA